MQAQTFNLLRGGVVLDSGEERGADRASFNGFVPGSSMHEPKQKQPTTMTMTNLIHGLAVVGKNNEPLYLYGCNSQEADAADDTFGFDSIHKQQPGRSLSYQHQLVLFAALDHLQDTIYFPNRTACQMPIIKQPHKEIPHYVGKIWQDDDQGDEGNNRRAVFGYVTATNVNFLVLVDNQVKEDCVQVLLQKLHAAYIRYLLNPFTNTKGYILESPSFDRAVEQAVQEASSVVVE